MNTDAQIDVNAVMRLMDQYRQSNGIEPQLPARPAFEDLEAMIPDDQPVAAPRALAPASTEFQPRLGRHINLWA